MSLVGLILRSTSKTSSHVSNESGWWSSWIGGKGHAGVAVDEAKALSLSTVWACVEGISSDVGVLPLQLYRRLTRGKERATEHASYPLLLRRPNHRMSAMAFREALTAHALNWGRGVAEIERTGDGTPVALWPLRPERTTPYIKGGELYWKYQPKSGGAVVLPDADVFHVHGLGYDGITGYNVIRIAAESMGGALAADEYGHRFFGNGAMPAVVLEHPGKIGGDATKRLRESWEELYGGTENSHRVGVLEEGMKLNRFSIPPEEAQFLQTRQFGVAEICRWYRYPPHKAGDLSRATFANIEQQELSYGISCLLRWLVRWEQEAARKLLRPGEQDQFFFEHTMNAFLRADIKTRFESYAVGVDKGWLSADDVREFESQNPIRDNLGDVYTLPVNRLPVERMLAGGGGIPDPTLDPKPPAKKPAAPAAPTDDPEADETNARPRPSAAIVRAMVDGSEPALSAAYAERLRLEGDRIQRAHKHRELAAWATSFYPTHPDHVRSALWPVVESCVRSVCAVAGVPYAGESASAVVAQLAHRYVERSRLDTGHAVVAGGIPTWAGGDEKALEARVRAEFEDARETICAALEQHLSKETTPCPQPNPHAA